MDDTTLSPRDRARQSLAQQQAANNPIGPSISNWEMVELTVAAGSTGRVNFPTQSKLRNQADQIVWIQNIELFTVTTYAASQLTNTIPGMPVTEIPKAVLVLYASGWEKQHYIPLAKLVRINDFAFTPYQPWEQYFSTMEDVQWESSYIQFNAASAAFDYVMPFGVTYIKANVS